jgi:hypothetical protein
VSPWSRSPDLAQFLTRWRDLIEVETGGQRSGGQSRDQDRWLREAVRRTEAAEGLASPAPPMHGFEVSSLTYHSPITIAELT